MQYDDIPQTRAHEFQLETSEDTRRFGHLIGEYFKEETQNENPELVRRLGLLGDRDVGKTELVNGINDALGNKEIYDIHQGERQSLTFADSVGWIRHYDMMISRVCGITLAAYTDPDFWDEHATGLDISENARTDDHKDFTLFVNLDKETEAQNSPRIAELRADESYENSPAYQNLIKKLYSEFPTPSAPEEHAQAELS